MFRPPSLLAPQVVPTAANTPAGQPGLLRPGTSCFVASARTGYANRPNTGNWRCRDSHPARLPALSAAPISHIRLSDKTSRLRPRLVVPKPAQAYEPEVPVKVREWIGPALASPDLMLEAQPPA
jgi:hypothetical protein